MHEVTGQTHAASYRKQKTVRNKLGGNAIIIVILILLLLLLLYAIFLHICIYYSPQTKQWSAEVH